MIGAPHDLMLRAATGLEGGCVALGSTCGLVTGGALGLALVHNNALQTGDVAVETALLGRVGEYVKWFESAFGSSFCRECTRIDFYSFAGQLRYLVPGDRVVGCLGRIRGAGRYLYELKDRALPVAGRPETPAIDSNRHCARNVLGEIRRRTGLKDPQLEAASLVFDGGIGLSGGLCGALAGAVMGINLLLGLDAREISYVGIARAFLVGHINLLIKDTAHKRETFAVGKGLVSRFKQAAGDVACAAITGKQFGSHHDFQTHMASSDRCVKLISHAADLAVGEIEKWEHYSK